MEFLFSACSYDMYPSVIDWSIAQMIVAASVDDMTPEWLSAALCSEVVGVRADKIGTGQMGANYRLHLTWDGPPTLVAKLASGDEEARARVAVGYRSEVRFYTELASTVRVRTPRCWYGAIADDGRTFTLLLDDLAPAVPGVQVDGCTVEQAVDAVENLARLHAPRWCDPDLKKVELSALDADAAAFLGDVVSNGVCQFVDRHAGHLDEADVSTMRDAALVVPEFLLCRPERFSLIHGDYRLDNLMFGDEVHVVDWQSVGVGLPGRDVGYFLGTSLHTQARRTHEVEIVAAYHRALEMEDYTAEDCWDDYRVGILQGPLITVLGAVFATAERTKTSDAMFLAMTRRSCAAIRDLDSLGAV